jgi:hypothetical protein
LPAAPGKNCPRTRQELPAARQKFPPRGKNFRAISAVYGFCPADFSHLRIERFWLTRLGVSFGTVIA